MSLLDERKLRGESHETVIAIFNCELQNIFNQEIEYISPYFKSQHMQLEVWRVKLLKGNGIPLRCVSICRYFNKSINRNRATNSSSTAMSTVNFCVSVSIRLLIKERNTSTHPYTACRYWFTYGPRCCTPDQGTTCSTTRPVAEDLKWVRSGATSQQSGL